jgi:hypothetical protein
MKDASNTSHCEALDLPVCALTRTMLKVSMTENKQRMDRVMVIIFISIKNFMVMFSNIKGSIQ